MVQAHIHAFKPQSDYKVGRQIKLVLIKWLFEGQFNPPQKISVAIDIIKRNNKIIGVV